MSYPEQFVEFACAVAEFVHRNADFVEQCDVKIGQRRAFRVNQMASAFEAAGASAHDHGREWAVRVAIAVAEPRAVKDDRVVEQRSLAVARPLQSFEERREQRRVMYLDLRALLELFGIVLVVRNLMMRIRDAELRIRASALLAPVHERGDPRQIALEREHLEVVEQPHVLVERVGNADWTSKGASG